MAEPIAEVSSKKVPLISYVGQGLSQKNPIEAFDGSLEYILTDNEVSDFYFALRIERRFDGARLQGWRCDHYRPRS